MQDKGYNYIMRAAVPFVFHYSTKIYNQVAIQNIWQQSIHFTILHRQHMISITIKTFWFESGW